MWDGGSGRGISREGMGTGLLRSRELDVQEEDAHMLCQEGDQWGTGLL